MKRIIFSLLVLGATLVSCDKQETPETAQQFETLDISFAAEGEYELTRGYFDGGTVPETWEKELKSVEVIICQYTNIYLRRFLSAEELSAKKVSLAIPSLSNSDWAQYPAKLYFFANYAVPVDINDVTELDALIDGQPGMYNSPGDASTPGPKWETGFTMVAKHEVKGRTPEDLNVSITLKRTVSKIAVKVSIDPDFSANHQGGKLEITGASVARAASDCRIFLPQYSGETPSAMDFSHSIGAVKSETDKEFVFYLYPNKRLTYSDPTNPAIVIEGVFDRDGNPATTDDLFDVRYEVFINESDGGRIDRNRVYKYDLKVVGLGGAQVEASYRIDHWLTTDIQEVEAGN